jgi:hypothetical protein
MRYTKLLCATCEVIETVETWRVATNGLPEHSCGKKLMDIGYIERHIANLKAFNADASFYENALRKFKNKL